MMDNDDRGFLTLDNLVDIINNLPSTSEKWRGTDVEEFFRVNHDEDSIKVLCRLSSKEYENNAYRCEIYPTDNEYTNGQPMLMVYCKGYTDYLRLYNFDFATKFLGEILDPAFLWDNIPRENQTDTVCNTEEAIERLLNNARMEYIKDYYALGSSSSSTPSLKFFEIPIRQPRCIRIYPNTSSAPTEIILFRRNMLVNTPERRHHFRTRLELLSLLRDFFHTTEGAF